MKILQKGVALVLRIFAPKKQPDGAPTDAVASGTLGADSGFELFAVCAIELGTDKERPESGLEHFVEKVQDSSRYFAVRIVDGRSQRSTYVGIGFRERETAFSFSSILQDHVRYVRRQREAATRTLNSARKTGDAGDGTGAGGGGGDGLVGSLLDLSLKAGETIKINVGGLAGGTPQKKKKKATGGGGGGLFSLSAPSYAGTTLGAPTVPTAAAPAMTLAAPAAAAMPAAAADAGGDDFFGDDDFGDFQSA